MSRLSKEREAEIRCMLEDCPPEQGDADVLAEVLGELDAVRAEREVLLSAAKHGEAAIRGLADDLLAQTELEVAIAAIEAAREQP